MIINCNGKLIDLRTPKIMGVLNITPDSFYDGGQYKNKDSILNQTEKMISEGATFIDIGAYSSRPDADDIAVEEELNRLRPVLKLLNENFGDDILMSVDTFRSKVADFALNNNVAMINDISGGLLDDNMLEIMGRHQKPYVLMHMKGNPQNMKELAVYEDVVLEVKQYFSERVNLARQKGISDIIIDPGFGFAKNITHNFDMLSKFQLFKSLELPILCGISRKSMIYKTLNTTPQNALNGTTALHSIALSKGANILRVHDVKEAKECILLSEKLQNS